MRMSIGRRGVLRLGAAALAASAPAMSWATAEAPARARLPLGPMPDSPMATAPAPVASTPVAPLSGAPVRKALLHNLHTGETFNEVYFENGRYVPQALTEAMKVLRDWRNGEEHFMDPRLFDALHGISDRLETNRPFQIISGYRSPRTNAMLHARSGEVASKSQHTLGKACDVRIEGVDLRNLHKAALGMGAGGVGLYPVSNFVHVDVGAVRHWMGA
ncbi:MAG: Twin-arginine translocation pathway signal [Caulobacter sp.]|nr:Twin-arginine translocation pathway signal [Caulobacter sp.]